MLDSLLSILPWIVALTGPIWASFFCAKIMRETGETKVSSVRSACDSCGHTLSAFDLVPILSFVALRGRCRYCGARIGWKIFGAEILGLVLFSILAIGIVQFVVPNSNLNTVAYALAGYVVLCCLLYLSIYDAYTYSIPNTGVQVAVGIAVVINVLVLISRLLGVGIDLPLGNLDNLLAGLGFGLFFQTIILLTKQKGMGVGDVVVAVIIGLCLGWPSVVTSFYAMIISAAALGVVVAWRRGKFRGTLLPLVPFMSFGFVVAYVWGVPIYNLLFRIV